MHVHFASSNYLAVTEQRPSGVGTNVWVGELRGLDGEPVPARIGPGGKEVSEADFHGGFLRYPVSVGVDEGQVLTLLVARARSLDTPTPAREGSPA